MSHIFKKSKKAKSGPVELERPISDEEKESLQ